MHRLSPSPRLVAFKIETTLLGFDFVGTGVRIGSSCGGATFEAAQSTASHPTTWGPRQSPTGFAGETTKQRSE